MKTVTIYTDGACSGNPGPGGWGAILMYGPHSRELSGGEAATTNNRMELTAVIQALSLLKEPCIVDLWSDSKYVIDDCEGTPDLILIASGSEVELSVKAKEILAAEGRKVRVVSMPCMDLFEEQSAEYKESVLPKEVRKRVAVEALSDFGWGKYVGLDGACVTMTGFGASGPAAQLFEHFGFTAEHVADVARSL